MSRIVDRRLNGKNKSAVNRQRFIRRYKSQIKKAVSDAVADRSIRDIESNEKISIPARDISEPNFRHGSGGHRKTVHPGNSDFIKGDKIERPPQGGGQGKGGEASDSGEGEDDFVFQISKDEFLDLFFEDLALPNLTKKDIQHNTKSFKYVRAGYANEGVPSNISIIRS